jgi:NAD(P)-dependent dehydrogenase (short-subunit alcohol dehydrogenase family)
VKLGGSRVWITGASSGIGEALAAELAARGARVAISARRADLLEQQAQRQGMVPVPVDVSDRAAVQAAAATVREELGGIDVAILNAASYGRMDVTAWDPDVFRRQVEVNLMGMVYGIEAVLPDMRRARSGTIVGMASVAGYRGLPSSQAYGPTKAAQINLLESLRIDLQPLGIAVTTVCPGFVRTDLTAGNTFRMPWILEPNDAARRIVDGLARGKAEIVFPWQMMLALKAARLVPVRLWSDIMSRQATTRHLR